jgi:hypothetical protein
MTWSIARFSTLTEELVGDISLDDLLREVFRAKLGLEETDPMYGSFPINAEMRFFLQSLLAVELPSDEFLFLEFT